MKSDTMLDKYLCQIGAAIEPVNNFLGLKVRVDTPVGWIPYVADMGMRVWVIENCPTRPYFCTNAVLTLHRVDGVVDGPRVIDILAYQQLEPTLRATEKSRKLYPAGGEPGWIGRQVVMLDLDCGQIESDVYTRVVVHDGYSMIAQLTTSALLVPGLKERRLPIASRPVLTVCAKRLSL
jgi:hypothetical protein